MSRLSPHIPELQSDRAPAEARPSRAWAMLNQRCPRCLRGSIFRGQLDMHERCPVCDLEFGREPGYFTGAMYLSYTLAVPLLAALALLFWGLTRWPVENILIATGVTFVLFVPLLFRYSRVLWLYIDHALDRD